MVRTAAGVCCSMSKILNIPVMISTIAVEMDERIMGMIT